MIVFGCTTTKYWCRSNSEVEKRYALAQHCCAVSLERTKNFTRPCINMSLKIFKGFNATICLSFSSDGPMVSNYKHSEIICTAAITDVSQKTSLKVIYFTFVNWLMQVTLSVPFYASFVIKKLVLLTWNEELFPKFPNGNLRYSSASS